MDCMRRLGPSDVLLLCTLNSDLVLVGRKSFWNWLFRGSRQPFEIVVLDHGTYLDLPVDLRYGRSMPHPFGTSEISFLQPSHYTSPILPSPLRELFCQLWCSFAACDLQV